MNLNLLNKSLVATAAILLGANFYVRSSLTATRARESISAPAPTNAVASQPEEPNAVANVTTTNETHESPPAITLASVRWAPLEAEDYSQYMANLRRFGFPEELIRQIIIAEIDSLYAPRIDPLKQKPIPPDAPMSERRRKPTPQDIVRMRELQKVLDEKEQHLQSLGISAPREMIRTPNSRNWEAHEYAVSLMPPEKQAAVRKIQEDLWIQDDYNQSGAVDYTAGNKTELEAYRAAAQQRNAALKAILTPEEFALFQLHTMPQGTELSRNTIGMDPTDDELMAMFRVTDEYWKKTGGVHGRWRAEPVPSDQIKQADRELQSDLQRVLGPERYVDYQMATTGTGQQMNNLASRYDLSRETIRQAFDIQNQLDSFNNLANRYGVPTALPQRDQLQQKLQQTLGPSPSKPGKTAAISDTMSSPD